MVVTRRHANAEPAQPVALEQSTDITAPPQTPAASRPKRSRRAAASAQPESRTRSVVEVTDTTRKVTTTSRAPSATPATSITTTTKRRTRSTKTEAASPLRALPQQPERPAQKRKRLTKKSASETPEPEPKRQHEPEQEQQPPQPDPEIESVHDDSDDQGIFFSKNFDVYSVMGQSTPPAAKPEIIQGSESALALLRKVEGAAKQSARVADSPAQSPEQHNEDFTPSSTQEETRASPEPPRTPTSFFSRSFSALKSTFGFSSPSKPSPTPFKTHPEPNTFTEVLSIPPTPVGERVQTPSKKKKRNPMLRALTRGVLPADKIKADKWAKQVIADMKNDSTLGDKRKRLEQPVLYKDLNYLPSSKPWETGFGDPLGDMDLDDDDVVPGWAVYTDLLAEEEEHRAKRSKPAHESLNDDDIASLNDLYAVNTSAPSSQELIDTNGHSASLLDLHPRRATDPSPIFSNSLSHQRGGNVFEELKERDVASEMYTKDRESLQRATKDVVHSSVSKPTHNPNQGSFSVPDEDSDDDDTATNDEASPSPSENLWTQPPPPAPVPAHAPLPGATPSTPPSPTTSQPVDEIERQRQRLMKHTPAKPSRLREATYPSPSVMSDAGNESILMATPLHSVELFADMPEAEPLDLDEDDLAAAEAFAASDEFKRQLAASIWSEPILTYESDEEEVSSE